MSCSVNVTASGLKLVMDRIMTPVPVPGGMTLSDELVGYCHYRDGILVPEDGKEYYVLTVHQTYKEQ